MWINVGGHLKAGCSLASELLSDKVSVVATRVQPPAKGCKYWGLLHERLISWIVPKILQQSMDRLFAPVRALQVFLDRSETSIQPGSDVIMTFVYIFQDGHRTKYIPVTCNGFTWIQTEDGDDIKLLQISLIFSK